jgi:phosphatidylcholine synthase
MAEAAVPQPVPGDLKGPGNETGARMRSYAVHAYTASGAALAFLAAAETSAPTPDARVVFLYLTGAVLIDSTDGPLARRWQVERWLPEIEGRTIDDIVDFLTYTFVPLFLMWRMDWLPWPAAAWVIPALVASLFGFANSKAKDEVTGFFLGFPSYWNVVAFYGGFWHGLYGAWVNGVLLLSLAILTVAPVRFLYPTRAPRRWRLPLIAGALVWLTVLLVLLLDYPRGSAWLVWLSLLYPAFYIALSVRLDLERARRAS